MNTYRDTTTVDQLGLSTRSTNCLTKGGYTTLRDVIELFDEPKSSVIASMPFFGAQSYDEVDQFLRSIIPAVGPVVGDRRKTAVKSSRIRLTTTTVTFGKEECEQFFRQVASAPDDAVVTVEVTLRETPTPTFEHATVSWTETEED